MTPCPTHAGKFLILEKTCTSLFQHTTLYWRRTHYRLLKQLNNSNISISWPAFVPTTGELATLKNLLRNGAVGISVKNHSGNTRPVIGPSFDIGGSVLSIVDHVKDLGVLVDDCLKFHLHVSSAFTRANLILKCFNSRNVQVLLRAFKGLCAANHWICF